MFATTRGTNLGAFGGPEWALFLTSGLGFGSAFVFIAFALQTTSPGLITLGRGLLGAAAIYLLPQARRRVDVEDRVPMLVLSLFLVAIPLSLIPIAQQWISSALTGMLGGAMPIFAALISSFLLKAAPRRNQVLGIGLGFVGTILVSSTSLGEEPAAALGVGLVILATASYALAVNLAAPMQQKYGSPAVMARCLLVGSLATLPLAWLTRGGTSFELSALLAIVVCGVFSTGVANAAFGGLIGRAGSTRASIVAYLVPVVAVVLGVVVRGEEVKPVALVGVAVILLGAWLTSRSEL